MCPSVEEFFLKNYINTEKKKTIPQTLQEEENHGMKYSMVMLRKYSKLSY